jgi:hypothetical protein
MAAYVKRSAAMFGAKVTVVHVFDLYSHDAFQLYVRSVSEAAREHPHRANSQYLTKAHTSGPAKQKAIASATSI